VRFFYPLFSIIFIFCMGGFGISYATWSDTLTLESTVSTGYINTIFTDAELSKNGNEGEGKGNCRGGSGSDADFGTVVIDEDGKSLLVSIKEKGNYYLDFTLENKGTLPVEIEIPDTKGKKPDGEGQAIKIEFKDKGNKEDRILFVDDSMQGRMEIKVQPPHWKDGLEGNFSVTLESRQASLK
jgi:hypothetical protein